MTPDASASIDAGATVPAPSTVDAAAPASPHHPTPHSAPGAHGSSAPHAAAVPGDVTAAQLVTCNAQVNPNAVAHAQFDMAKTPMTGTVLFTGSDLPARKFRVHAEPHAATYVLMFDGYGEGDQKPPTAKEAFTAKSIVARLVTIGSDDKLFFDGDVKLVTKGGATSTALACQK